MLEVEDLTVSFRGGRHRVVEGVSFALKSGQALGIVGESGSGKSTVAAAIMGMLPNGGRIDGGRIRFDGDDLTALSESELRLRRGRILAMIPQDANGALNPVFTVGNQLSESLTLAGVPSVQHQSRARSLLAEVQISAPERRLSAYPHMLSGGIKQRVLGAMAIATEARLVLADEPTTALDVTVQAQFLKLLGDLRQAHGFTLVLISHDLGVISSSCDEVAVMYAGQIVEQGPSTIIFANPQHPYTQALLAARPRLDASDGLLATIPGEPPTAARWPVGCRFSPRCSKVINRCRQVMPAPSTMGVNHTARCFVAAREQGSY
jgi:oligopeptide/dipeptide ABC transporter ATP-binding protein